MKKSTKYISLCTASAVALMMTAAPVFAQDAAPDVAAATADDTQTVVVIGQRNSLQKAANIKRRSDNVVDSIVADDIGKFPDNTVAAALQRVPGVQTSNGYNNEIQGVIIRGLGDIETTLDGREIFTGVGRGFAFQDLPAESVSGVDVYKSNSADLIEGGVAGVINIKRQKPFNFKKGLTFAGNVRYNYGQITEKSNGVASILVSDRFDTNHGEMGLLLDASYSKQEFSRPISFNCDPRSGTNGPSGGAGSVLPTCVGGLTDTGTTERPQILGVFQWKPNDNLELYADAQYAGWKSTFATYFIFSDIFGAQNITNVENTDTCFDSLVDAAGFYTTHPAGTDGVTMQHLCMGSKATFNNVAGLTSTQAKEGKTDQYIYGGGAKWHSGGFSLNWDLSYIRSYNANRNTIVDVAKTIPTVNISVNDDHHGSTDMPGNPLGDPAGFVFANGLFQDYNRSYSDMFQTRIDGAYSFTNGFIKQIQFGYRYADRDAQFYAVTDNPSGFSGGRNVLVDSVGLPDDFMIQSPSGIPVINGGAKWYTPNPDFLRDHTDELRTLWGVPTGDPAWDPTRTYKANEMTWAFYAQLKYGFDFANGWSMDGLIGGRESATDRELSGTGTINVIDENGDVTPVPNPQTRSTKDKDFLPNFSARLKVSDHLQFRASAARTLSRPFFGDLNPGISYDNPANPNVKPSGSGGNPDLRAEKSDNYDLTAEYYWGRSNYVSIAGYDRKITDRTQVQSTEENIGGRPYLVTRPRNVAGASLDGFEVAGQMFFDFLPEGWNGLGMMANYTRANSEINTPGDPLNGEALQGVSKNSYNIGLLYEKYNVTARVVYNWRDTYTDGYFGAGSLTPGTDAKFNYVRPNGRLDFSIAYDINEHYTVSVDGVNVNGGKYYSYFDTPIFPHDIRFDDKFYGVTLRMKY